MFTSAGRFAEEPRCLLQLSFHPNSTREEGDWPKRRAALKKRIPARCSHHRGNGKVTVPRGLKASGNINDDVVRSSLESNLMFREDLPSFKGDVLSQLHIASRCITDGIGSKFRGGPTRDVRRVASPDCVPFFLLCGELKMATNRFKSPSFD